LENSRRRRTNW